MKVHVQLGQVGPAGATALLNVMVEANREPGLVSMEKRVTVQDLQLMNNNAIDKRVGVKCFIGTTNCLGAIGIVSLRVIFLVEGQFSNNVLIIVSITVDAILSLSHFVITAMHMTEIPVISILEKYFIKDLCAGELPVMETPMILD